jgi:hypothetical protein
MQSAQPTTPDPRSWTADGFDSPPHPGHDGRPLLCLPVLTRLASPLTLLLQDGAVDLELTSSVVALDPGLAFTTLQLANRGCRDEGEAIWQFPLAVVAGGQQRLLQAINRAPKIESYCSGKIRAESRRFWLRAVVRACVARALNRQLGSGNVRQAFLAGLLLELPALVKLTSPSNLAALPELQAASRETLPLGINAAIGQARHHTRAHTYSGEQALGSLSASLRLAELLLGRTMSKSALSPAKAGDLAASLLWQHWEETSLRKRQMLLNDCCALAKWAAVNAPTMNPWEFTAKLERSKGWE